MKTVIYVRGCSYLSERGQPSHSSDAEGVQVMTNLYRVIYKGVTTNKVSNIT